MAPATMVTPFLLKSPPLPFNRRQFLTCGDRNIGDVVRLTEVNQNDSVKMSLQVQKNCGCETICEVGKRQGFVWLRDG
jgi:hypothetical protein